MRYMRSRYTPPRYTSPRCTPAIYTLAKRRYVRGYVGILFSNFQNFVFGQGSLSPAVCGRFRSADAIPPAGLQGGIDYVSLYGLAIYPPLPRSAGTHHAFGSFQDTRFEHTAAVAATTILTEVLDLLKAPRLRSSSSLALKSIRLDCKVSSS